VNGWRLVKVYRQGAKRKNSGYVKVYVFRREKGGGK